MKLPASPLRSLRRRSAPIDPSAIPPALTGGEFQLVTSDVGDLWISRQDEVMRPYLARKGTWEAAEGRLLRTYIKPGCRFLDVGANIGYFSLLAARSAPGVVVDAVEPHPGIVPVLRMNLWTGRVARADLARRPRCRRPGRAPRDDAHQPRRHRASRRRPAMAPLDRALVASMVAPAAVGDELFPDVGFDVVKVDVQGYELEVVTGLQGVMARSTGIILVAEFWPSALRERGLRPVDVIGHYGDMGLDVVTQIDERLESLTAPEIVRVCDTAGPDGQVNLVLTRR